ncbi:ribosome biogenesis GTP-binding protein YihA/YsxC [Desulfobacterales bacterium RS19-109]|uniref:Probable GTP-binding protein EngB n=1 Tax=Thiovibrio frasassiensis TaxID=2984131 RepID=A0A9X4MF75_9BACT|nr:ribosome biogenesis GTP-binding protein YihA/YsxC [Thiovibrio frasassiensis]MDG4476116.1 ribosome biogenesis GTP-binding protein YihA/YsxC [Thiovibrio frasassiensis]
MTDSAVNYAKIEFVKSAFKMAQLPEEPLPEIAFAGRSNVGKSSLINRLVNRKGLVKVSARPGKTQSLNYFLVDEKLYLVDLPGYGFAKVSKKLQDEWQGLVTEYLSTSPTLRCVVVLIDLRHLLKAQDRELVEWLRMRGRPFIIVYTKRDKLSNNEQAKQAANLDAALGLNKQERVLFSAKTGEGKEALMAAIATFLG